MKFLLPVLLVIALTAQANPAVNARSGAVNTCPPQHKNFRECFKNEVKAGCKATGHRFICSHMKLIYRGMLMRYGSLYKACKKNTHARNRKDAQKKLEYCLNDWSCYIHGTYYNSRKICGYRRT